MKKGISIILSCVLCTTLVACGNNNDKPNTQASTSVSITKADLPNYNWQSEVIFPDWAGYVDDTLAMNSSYTFKGYKKQGVLYVTPDKDVTSFELFVNNEKVDTSKMEGGNTYQVSFENVSNNGDNTILVNNIEPKDLEKAVKVDIPYPTVIQGELAEVGLSEKPFEVINDIITADIENGFTSAQLAVVKDGALVYQNAWGNLNSYNQDGTKKEDSEKVTNDTLYDLASNTKMYSVNYALQYLVTNEKIKLDDKIVDIIGPEFVNDTISIAYDGFEPSALEQNKAWKQQLTLKDLLTHQGGFPPDPQYHNDLFDQITQKPNNDVKNVLYSGSDGTPETKKATLHSICKTPLMYEPHTMTKYSDVDYMLLGLVIEQITGKPLDVFMKETFYEPMGLTHITYNPLLNGFEKENCAATELNGNTRDGAINFNGVRKDTLQGQVHDEKAFYAMSGVSGHAGLFANATDLAKLASTMLVGGYEGNKFFSRNVIDSFIAPKALDAANWGLGWMREGTNQRVWYFGTESSSNTVGHQGWTGTLTMIDPETNLVVVYLTNKINSPVTDKESNPNKFNGNWFTSSSLGFVPQLIQMSLNNNNDLTEPLGSLLANMATEKFRLISAVENADENHPIVKAGYAVVEAGFAYAKDNPTEANWNYAKQSLSLLDESRDKAEIEKLTSLLPKK